MSEKSQADQWVRTLVEHAKDLREAGVTRVRCGDVEADIAPKDAEIHFLNANTGEVVDPDPLKDPATYGYRYGNGVPGFSREGVE